MTKEHSLARNALKPVGSAVRKKEQFKQIEKHVSRIEADSYTSSKHKPGILGSFLCDVLAILAYYCYNLKKQKEMDFQMNAVGVTTTQNKEADQSNDIAILSSFDKYTTFSFGGKTLTFRTCNGLERYTSVITWDHGYLEVMAKYSHEQNEIEEYIDLLPVLENLYMDADKFLAPIKEVKIQYV